MPWSLPHADVALDGPPPSGAARAGAAFLDRRTGHVAVGTVDAAVAWLGLEDDAAALAIVEILAGVGRHGLHRLMAAVRTGQRGAGQDLHVAHRRALRIKLSARGSTIG